MFGMVKTLIVVYKDEMLVNQLKKLVETKDDSGDEQIVGTRDASINIVAWTEKVWLVNKKAGNIKDKVLFLGDIKGTDKLIPVVDVKFDDCGVKYGWAGNQAIIFTNPKAVSAREDYLDFVRKLAKLPVPDTIKQPKNARVEETNITEAEDQINEVIDKEKGKALAFLLKAKDDIRKGIDTVDKAGTIIADKTGDLLRDKNAVKQQMLFYGVINLYRKGLEEFMTV